MWAADDYYPDFIKENLYLLQSNDKHGSISKVVFKDNSGNLFPSFSDSLNGYYLKRIKFFLNNQVTIQEFIHYSKENI